MTTPNGWKRGYLGEKCSIEIGGTPSRNTPDYWDDSKETSNLWVSIRDLNQRVITRTAEHITDAGVKHSNVKLQPEGTVLLSFKLTIGRVAFAGCPLFTNEAIAGLRSEGITGEYLYHGLQQWDLLQGVDQAIKGATLNKEKLKKIEFDFPESLLEQTKIADILSTVDRAIEQTEALIAKQQRIKSGLMQDLLTHGIDEHGNLRSESTHKFKESALGRIPLEWEVTFAHELCDAVLDCKNRTPPVTREGHPVIRTPNVRGGEFVYYDLAYTDPFSYEIWVARGKPRSGDVVITREAPFGEACQIPGDLIGPCLGQRMMMYQTNLAKLRPDYLVYAIYSEAVQAKLLELAGGSTVGHIRVGDIRKLPIPHPIRVEEQGKIADALTASGKTLKNLDFTRRKLASLKTALMQDLLTGRKRVVHMLKPKTTH